MIKIIIISNVVLVCLSRTGFILGHQKYSFNFNYSNSLFSSSMIVNIFIGPLMRFISVHSAVPQETEDKICSTYKRKRKPPWIGCVVGQRSAMHQTSEMVTSILYGVSERPTRIGLVVSL